MAINRIFSFLTPKENKFFPLINSIGSYLTEASDTLVKFINCTDKDEMTELYAKIKSCERQSDEVLNTVFTELNETFITPFDREDIQVLCERLDDTLDYMNSAAKRVLLFQPKETPDAMTEICTVIRKCSYAIAAVLTGLKSINKNASFVREQCELLHDLEQSGDELYEEYVKHLFETEKDSIELIKKQGIMQELERTTDMAHSVGKIVKTMIVKYA